MTLLWSFNHKLETSHCNVAHWWPLWWRSWWWRWWWLWPRWWWRRPPRLTAVIRKLLRSFEQWGPRSLWRRSSRSPESKCLGKWKTHFQMGCTVEWSEVFRKTFLKTILGILQNHSVHNCLVVVWLLGMSQSVELIWHQQLHILLLFYYWLALVQNQQIDLEVWGVYHNHILYDT